MLIHNIKEIKCSDFGRIQNSLNSYERKRYKDRTKFSVFIWIIKKEDAIEFVAVVLKYANKYANESCMQYWLKRVVWEVRFEDYFVRKKNESIWRKYCIILNKDTHTHNIGTQTPVSWHLQKTRRMNEVKINTTKIASMHQRSKGLLKRFFTVFIFWGNIEHLILYY